MNNKYLEIYRSVKAEAAECVNLFRSKAITGKIATFLITCIIQPKLIYELLVAPMLPREINSIESMWMTVVKSKHLLLPSFPNIPLWHALYLKNMREHFQARQLTQYERLLRKESYNATKPARPDRQTYRDSNGLQRTDKTRRRTAPDPLHPP